MRAYDEEEESRARLVRKSAAVSSASYVVVNGEEERSCSGLMDMPPYTQCLLKGLQMVQLECPRH